MILLLGLIACVWVCLSCVALCLLGFFNVVWIDYLAWWDCLLRCFSCLAVGYYIAVCGYLVFTSLGLMLITDYLRCVFEWCLDWNLI